MLCCFILWVLYTASLPQHGLNAGACEIHNMRRDTSTPPCPSPSPHHFVLMLMALLPVIALVFVMLYCLPLAVLPATYCHLCSLFFSPACCGLLPLSLHLLCLPLLPFPCLPSEHDNFRYCTCGARLHPSYLSACATVNPAAVSCSAVARMASRRSFPRLRHDSSVVS